MGVVVRYTRLIIFYYYRYCFTFVISASIIHCTRVRYVQSEEPQPKEERSKNVDRKRVYKIFVTVVSFEKDDNR